MGSDLSKAFAKIIDSTYVRIDGFLVERGIDPSTGGEILKWEGHCYKNVDEVRSALNGVYNLISLSIVNPNGIVKQLGPEYAQCYSKGEGAYEKYKKDHP